ncbi:MAG: DinB family protein [Acidimicrobiales bacterium]
MTSAQASATEHDRLIAALDANRTHILQAIDGLDDEQLRRPTLPSGWSLIGLIRHLTLADERYWFDSIVGGAPFGWFPEEPGADWIVDDDESVADVIAEYKAEIERSNTTLRAARLDGPPRQRDPLWDEWGIDFPDVRYIALHMLTETAVHAGHVDAVRELIDGKQWIVLT